MKRFYHPSEVKARIAALIAAEDKDSAVEETYKQTFFDPQIRGAAWAGVGLATFQQLTGANIINLYSADFFPDSLKRTGPVYLNYA